jgi:hypothetical protein
MSDLTIRVVGLYREGKNFSQIGELLKIDRHKVPHILTAAKEPMRTPFQGTKAEWSKLYEKTPKGFLMRTYRNMQSRVTGVQKKKAHLYKGLPILSRNDFYAWAWDNPDFWRLYKQWAATDYDRKLSPSINRLDTNKGYTIDNMEWLTHSVNSSLGGSSLKRKSNTISNLMEVYEHVQA